MIFLSLAKLKINKVCIYSMINTNDRKKQDKAIVHNLKLAHKNRSRLNNIIFRLFFTININFFTSYRVSEKKLCNEKMSLFDVNRKQL